MNSRVSQNLYDFDDLQALVYRPGVPAEHRYNQELEPPIPDLGSNRAAPGHSRPAPGAARTMLLVFCVQLEFLCFLSWPFEIVMLRHRLSLLFHMARIYLHILKATLDSKDSHIASLNAKLAHLQGNVVLKRVGVR